MADDKLVFNGIDGDTGQYAIPPLSAEELVAVIRGQATPDNLSELRFRVQQSTTGFLGVKEGVDPKDLAQAGWGVIFPAYPDSEPEKRRQVDAIREALQPLLQHREALTRGRSRDWAAGTGKGYYVGSEKETKNAYLARQGAGPGPADPDKVPYYLLIVGSPAEIPYRFQTQLDVQYAVGRIHFDTLQEYADYAASVVAMESGGQRLGRKAAFFGVANQDDESTRITSSRLIAPLSAAIAAQNADWDVASISPPQATKAALAALLGGPQTPSLLFTGSHGMNFGKDSPRQLPHQGALLCQDWPGPLDWKQPIPQDFYFAGDDLAADADLLGLIAFFFACYGGGTPQFNEFTRQDNLGAAPGAAPARQEIAAAPFLARLPVAMLGRPRGALAVVGHVERAWSYSFDWGRAGTQTTVFESALKRLLDGHPLGSALEFFNERYAELSTVLSDELEDIEFGKRFDPADLAGMWTANNDARGYAILGDPAVRLPVARGQEQPAERAAIRLSSTPALAPAPAATAAPAPESAVAVAPVAMGLLPPADDEVRTYVSASLASPPEGDLRIVTRRTAGGAVETIVHPNVADNAALLALHQAALERRTQDEGAPR